MPARKREASPPATPAEKPAPQRTDTREPVARCGGYVDRGDGNGWVLESEDK